MKSIEYKQDVFVREKGGDFMENDRKYVAILILIIVGLLGKCVYDVR